MYHRFGYYSTETWYEAVVDRLVADGCKWIDVGGGKSVFPHNPELAKELANRCKLLVAVDPSDNLDENRLAHQRVQCTIEEFRSEEVFDLATLRMVAEHIQRPELVVESLARAIKPGGRVVVYTPNRWSLVSIAASLIPNKWHNVFTHLLWNTEAEDVFPTYYRMNTRKRLRSLFCDGGFSEAGFSCLASCSTFARFRPTCFGELCIWRLLRTLRVMYPENDLLGVYERV
jgi:2-polyprenyl-3-methyl-5-hydroxy-6-metoxy-1,4-benzoquinol methylase